MDRALDLKPEVTQGCGFESRLRQEVHDCSLGAAQSAAHCSKCVHLDGLNAENTFHSSLYSRAGRYDQKFISRYFSKLYRFHGI